MSKRNLRIALALLANLILWGLTLPYLVSAPSDILVLLGLVIAGLSLPLSFFFIKGKKQ